MSASARRALASLLAAGTLAVSLTACQAAHPAAVPEPGTAQPGSSPPAAGQSATARPGAAGPGGQPFSPSPGAATPPATGAAVAAATAAVTAAAHIAPAAEFGNGTVYHAWITSLTPGTPARVSMELAWHYTGQAAAAYAAAHGLPAPTGDHLDVDRRFSATVTLSPSAQAAINPQGAGPQQLTATAFAAWAGQHPAVPAGGQYAGPLYAVTFHDDVLVSANQIFEP